VLLHTWLDRDLSLAGRVVVQQDGGAETRSVLVDLRRPVMRAANLAIHLNRNVNTEGLVVDPQKHVHPIVGLESDGSFDLRELLAAEVSHAGTSVAPSQVLGWELSAYDVQPSTRAGLRGEMLHAPRLDNLGSCHAATTALIATADSGPEATTGMVLYDHEECGSRSARGAFSPFMRTVLDRVLAARGDREPDAFPRAVARSFLVSADMAHAIHPNYADRHDSEHSPVLGGGPVLKLNVNQAYATDARAWSRFEALCRASDVTPQRFVNRGDMPCGTTIGPITASELGMETVDVGNPMLSMHSCREMAAAADVPRMIAVLQKHFNS
jgi:aspartyl aminopeptidase